jgi:prolyl 4-hydroxylase
MKDTSQLAPEQTLLSKSPRIVYSLNTVSPAVAKRVISFAQPKLQRALVLGAKGKVASQGRIARTVALGHDDHPTVRAVVDAISRVAGLDSRRADRLHVVRYGVGGEYRPHLDSYSVKTEGDRRRIAQKGQRILTALLYLNDGFVGGTTQFPLLGFAVVAQQGALLTFENCRRGSVIPHPKSVHAGAPVSRGVKWIAVLLFRSQPKVVPRPK